MNDWGPVVVPRDSLCFLGDNRDESYDGRYYGLVPRAFVTAVCWNRLLTRPD